MDNKISISIAVVLSIILFLVLMPVLSNQVENITEKSNTYTIHFTTDTTGDLDTEDFIDWFTYHIKNPNLSYFAVKVGEDTYSIEIFSYDNGKYFLKEASAEYGVLKISLKLDTFQVNYNSDLTLTYPLTMTFEAVY